MDTVRDAGVSSGSSGLQPQERFHGAVDTEETHGESLRSDGAGAEKTGPFSPGSQAPLSNLGAPDIMQGLEQEKTGAAFITGTTAALQAQDVAMDTGAGAIGGTNQHEVTQAHEARTAVLQGTSLPALPEDDTQDGRAGARLQAYGLAILALYLPIYAFIHVRRGSPMWILIWALTAFFGWQAFFKALEGFGESSTATESEVSAPLQKDIAKIQDEEHDAASQVNIKDVRKADIGQDEDAGPQTEAAIPNQAAIVTPQLAAESRPSADVQQDHTLSPTRITELTQDPTVDRSQPPSIGDAAGFSPSPAAQSYDRPAVQTPSDFLSPAGGFTQSARDTPADKEQGLTDMDIVKQTPGEDALAPEFGEAEVVKENVAGQHAEDGYRSAPLAPAARFDRSADDIHVPEALQPAAHHIEHDHAAMETTSDAVAFAPTEAEEQPTHTLKRTFDDYLMDAPADKEGADAEPELVKEDVAGARDAASLEEGPTSLLTPAATPLDRSAGETTPDDALKPTFNPSEQEGGDAALNTLTTTEATTSAPNETQAPPTYRRTPSERMFTDYLGGASVSEALGADERIDEGVREEEGIEQAGARAARANPFDNDGTDAAPRASAGVNPFEGDGMDATTGAEGANPFDDDVEADATPRDAAKPELLEMRTIDLSSQEESPELLRPVASGASAAELASRGADGSEDTMDQGTQPAAGAVETDPATDNQDRVNGGAMMVMPPTTTEGAAESFTKGAHEDVHEDMKPKELIGVTQKGNTEAIAAERDPVHPHDDPEELDVQEKQDHTTPILAQDEVISDDKPHSAQQDRQADDLDEADITVDSHVQPARTPTVMDPLAFGAAKEPTANLLLSSHTDNVPIKPLLPEQQALKQPAPDTLDEEQHAGASTAGEQSAATSAATDKPGSPTSITTTTTSPAASSPRETIPIKPLVPMDQALKPPTADMLDEEVHAGRPTTCEHGRSFEGNAAPPAAHCKPASSTTTTTSSGLSSSEGSRSIKPLNTADQALKHPSVDIDDVHKPAPDTPATAAPSTFTSSPSAGFSNTNITNIDHSADDPFPRSVNTHLNAIDRNRPSAGFAENTNDDPSAAFTHTNTKNVDRSAYDPMARRQHEILEHTAAGPSLPHVTEPLGGGAQEGPAGDITQRNTETEQHGKPKKKFWKGTGAKKFVKKLFGGTRCTPK